MNQNTLSRFIINKLDTNIDYSVNQQLVAIVNPKAKKKSYTGCPRVKCSNFELNYMIIRVKKIINVFSEFQRLNVVFRQKRWIVCKEK